MQKISDVIYETLIDFTLSFWFRHGDVLLV